MLAVCAAVYLVCLGQTEGVHGGADTFSHFEIAKYSWKYPDLLLHHWGKPVFTLLASPFAQLGITFVECFNAIIMLYTAWFAYRIMSHFKAKMAWLVIPLVFFTPVYFQCGFSALTEPLFSLCVVLSLWFIVKEKYITAAIAIGFLPLIRTEGIFFLPLFGIAFLFLRNYKAILFIGLGGLIYSFIGWIVIGDFLWLIHQLPYGGSKVYPDGTFWHYVSAYDMITGTAMGWTFLVGLLLLPLYLMRTQLTKTQKLVVLLTLGCLTLYFGLHSFLWWKGLAGALGLNRIMAAITPLMVMIMWFGLQSLANVISNKKIAAVALTGLAILCLYTVPAVPLLVPKYQMPETAVMQKAVKWLQDSPYADVQWNTYSPVTAFLGDRDPYDTKQIFRVHHPMQFPKGSILIWDAHFGPNEGQTPLDTLRNDLYLLEIQRFVPDAPFTVLGGLDYEIRIFITTGVPLEAQDWYTAVKADYETPETIGLDGAPEHVVMREDSSFVYQLGPNAPYNRIYEAPMEEAYAYFVDSLGAEVHVTLSDTAQRLDFSLVIHAIDSTGETVFYDRNFILPTKVQPGKNILSRYIPIPALPSTTTLKIYTWNAGQESIFIDDFKALFRMPKRIE